MREGKPAYEYNWLGLDRFVVESPTVLPTGKATIVLDFKYDDGGPGKGGLATLFVNGKKVAEGRIEKTQGYIFSADETADVGLDNQTPVALGIGYGPAETKFTGKIHKIVLEVK
jgi:arylsulfatase